MIFQSVVKEIFYVDHDNENEIDKEFDQLCDTIKDDMNLQIEANVSEPFGEFVKKVYVKPLEYKSTEVENDMNVEVIG